MASLLQMARIGVGDCFDQVGGGKPCCAACGNGAGACPCSDIDEKTKPSSSPPKFDENGNLLAAGVGDAPVVNNAPSSSSGPGFFTGLIVGTLISGAAATLLYVGLSDEGARRASLARRRSAGYAY